MRSDFYNNNITALGFLWDKADSTPTRSENAPSLAEHQTCSRLSDPLGSPYKVPPATKREISSHVHANGAHA